MNNYVYVLYLEKEASQACRIIGVWKNKENAIQVMKELVERDEQYSEYSVVDLENGIAQSDPTYSEDRYSDYKVTQISVE